MPAQHSLSRRASSFSERDLPPVVHLNVPIPHQALEHFCHCWRSDPKLLRQPRSNYHLILHIHIVDRLQIFFDGRTEWLFRFHSHSPFVYLMSTLQPNSSTHLAQEQVAIFSN